MRALAQLMLLSLLLLLQAGAARAQAVAAPGPALDAALSQRLQRLAGDAARAAWDGGADPAARAAGLARVEVELGQLDSRLTLAPCQHIEPYLPNGVRLAGRTRIGLRCLQGSTRWNVYLPITVKILARGLVAGVPLPAGTVLQPQHLIEAEVDLVARADPALTHAESAIGRSVAHAMAVGDALRQGDLRARQWFAAGDMVRVVARGAGFAVSAEGQALNAGMEGQPARVRTESGRIVTGMPTAERRVELSW